MDLFHNHIGDGTKPHALPIVHGRHADLKCIDATTLVKLIDGYFCDTIDSFTIVDCRYPYEYEGGHIINSINIYTREAVTREFIDSDKRSWAEEEEEDVVTCFSQPAPSTRTSFPSPQQAKCLSPSRRANRENSYSRKRSSVLFPSSPVSITMSPPSSTSSSTTTMAQLHSSSSSSSIKTSFPSPQQAKYLSPSRKVNRENSYSRKRSSALLPSSPVSITMSPPSSTSSSTTTTMAQLYSSSSLASSSNNKRHVLIFHCEFSSERAPSLLRHLRNKDRDINRNHYPRLMHPELYLLEGGYKAFYGQYKQYCVPQSYRPMGCKEHLEDLRVYKSMSRSRKRLKKC